MDPFADEFPTMSEEEEEEEAPPPPRPKTPKPKKKVAPVQKKKTKSKDAEAPLESPETSDFDAEEPDEEAIALRDRTIQYLREGLQRLEAAEAAAAAAGGQDHHIGLPAGAGPPLRTFGDDDSGVLSGRVRVPLPVRQGACQTNYRFCVALFRAQMKAFRPSYTSGALVPRTTYTTGVSISCKRCQDSNKECLEVRQPYS